MTDTSAEKTETRIGKTASVYQRHIDKAAAMAPTFSLAVQLAIDAYDEVAYRKLPDGTFEPMLQGDA